MNSSETLDQNSPLHRAFIPENELFNMHQFGRGGKLRIFIIMILLINKLWNFIWMYLFVFKIPLSGYNFFLICPDEIGGCFEQKQIYFR